MKQLFIIKFFIVLSFTAVAQTKYFTKSAAISFFSLAEEENIEAHSTRAVAIFEKESNSIEFSVLIKSFGFEKALMQEHFNENYMESDKYPKAVFKGVVEGFSSIDFSKNAEYKLNAKGVLTMHGVDNIVNTPIVLKFKDGKISLHSDFTVKLKDYNIKIPSVVGKKISETIKITLSVDEFKKLK